VYRRERGHISGNETLRGLIDLGEAHNLRRTGNPYPYAILVQPKPDQTRQQIVRKADSLWVFNRRWGHFLLLGGKPFISTMGCWA
jgi:hypothetical protein